MIEPLISLRYLLVGSLLLFWTVGISAQSLSPPSAQTTDIEPEQRSSEEGAEPEDEDGIPPEGTETWVDKSHRAIGRSIEATVLTLDTFFATEQYAADTTESFLRLRPEAQYDSQEKLETDFNVSGKLDLPGTKRRLKLLIDSDSSKLNQEVGIDVDDGGGGGGNGSIAIERESKRRLDQWRVRPALGVKSSMPPDPFVQLRATKYYALGENWLTRTQGTARYLLDDQGELRAELDFNREVAPDWLFRARTDVRWRDSKRRTDADQFFTFARRIDEKRSVAYSLGILADNDEGWDVQRYRYLIVHRQRIYKDWLFFEIRPEASLRNRDDGWRAGASLQLRLEAFFGPGRLRKIEQNMSGQ